MPPRGYYAGSGGTTGLNPGIDPGGGSGGGRAGGEVRVLSMRIEPASAELSVALGQSASLPFEVFGTLSTAPDEEVNLTETSVFYVPQGYLVGTFPADGSPTFSTRLPAGAGDPVQQGGAVTVEARAASSDGTVHAVTTTLLVKLEGALSAPVGSPEATPALPAEPSAAFSGSASAGFAPELYYPNDGVLLPPNLGRLEVHFQAGNAASSLFRVSFESPSSTLSYFTRCYSDPADFVADACALVLEGDTYAALAASNQGQGPVQLRVAGSDEAGNFGESAAIEVEFAEERIDGAVYYWTASSPESIVRFDFGNGGSSPELFATPSSVPGNSGSSCVGCHAISRQGDKMFFSLGNSQQGQLMFAKDMSVPQDDAAFFTYNGAVEDIPLPKAEEKNRVLTGSFSPSGDRFVAAAPENDPLPDTRLFFHDGTTGERDGFVDLPFVPSHPDWSPLGDAIAMTGIEGDNLQTISFLGGSIQLLVPMAGAPSPDAGSGSVVWDADNPIELVPSATGKNRFNPAFLPGGQVLLYTEVDDASYSGSRAGACSAPSPDGSGKFCNGYSDPAAKTWAVGATAGSTPVFLARAAAPGRADELFPPPQSDIGAADLMDTFPKPTPFEIQHRGTRLSWFTVGSQRRAGLRRFFPNGSVVGDPPTQATLWMFAIDPAAVLSGEDGSRPGFFLPFQDLTTSNHMAQWTERIVSDEPPPPAPPDPVPPAPPPAPPPPTILR